MVTARKRVPARGQAAHQVWPRWKKLRLARRHQKPVRWEQAVGADDCCAVCLSNFETGDAVVLPCNHVLHRECVQVWFSRRKQSAANAYIHVFFFYFRSDQTT